MLDGTVTRHFHDGGEVKISWAVKAEFALVEEEGEEKEEEGKERLKLKLRRYRVWMVSEILLSLLFSIDFP